jgi:hypothetical protein
MTVLNVEPSPSPEPSPTPSQLPDDKGLWGHIADVADFLFATKSIGRLFSGEGGWGDAAAVGITAASFFIPPVKLLKFAAKPLESIIVHAAEITASDTASAAAKSAALKTAKNAKYLLDNPEKHTELIRLTDIHANDPEATVFKLRDLPKEADHFFATGKLPHDFEASMAAHAEAAKEGNGISRSLYEEGLTDTAPNAQQADTLDELKDVSLTMSEMRKGTKYPKYPNLTQEEVDNLRRAGHGEDYIKAWNDHVGNIDEDVLKEVHITDDGPEHNYERGQDINLKEKLDWAVQHKTTLDEDGNIVETELQNLNVPDQPSTAAQDLDIVPKPKQYGSAARSYLPELQTDVIQEAKNLLQVTINGTPEEVARYKRSYRLAQNELQNALRSSKITRHAALAIEKQRQKDIVDNIFKIVVPTIDSKTSNKITKELIPTSEVTPYKLVNDVYVNSVKTKKVLLFDRIKHVKNIIAREEKLFLPESNQYKQLIKSKYNLDDPKQLAEYTKVIQGYQDELADLNRLQSKHIESVKSFVKDLDDNGIKYFVKQLNSRPLEELELLDHHVYLELLRDIFRQAKADDVKRSVATLGKRLSSIEKDVAKQQNKLKMQKRLERNAPLTRNEETLAKVQAMAKPEPKKPEVVADGLSKEERLAATKAKVEALAKTKPAEVVEKKTKTEPSSWSKAADDEVLVFGSNLEGRHGKGAALEAREKFGAKQGQAKGRQGQSYAIPTKDLKINKGLPLNSIKKDIDEFLNYAEAHPDERFFFSALGTGLAGHSPEDIASLISRTPSNVRFDPKIGDLIGRETRKTIDEVGNVVRWKSLTSAEQKDVVYIGRGSGDKGKFGNPFPVGNGVTVKEAVDKYSSWLWDKIKSDPEYAKELYALKGKRLACPGSEPNDACHGQVIIKAIKYLDKHPELISKTTSKKATSDIVVHSGGAGGSDTAWAKAADEVGIVTKGHSFVGHEKLNPNSAGFTGTRPALEERIIYTKEEINKAKPFIEKAARNLGVRPSDNDLVLRNYYQVKDSDAVIAIVERLSANKKTTSSGTRWGMQMGIDKGIPVHVFDQSVSKWFKWNGTVFEEAGLPPKFKSFAGIGTRDLKESGRQAIKDYIESLVKGK